MEPRKEKEIEYDSSNKSEPPDIQFYARYR